MYPCIRITACESQHTHLYIRIRTYVSPHYYIRTYVSLHYYIRIITYVGISKHAPLHTYHNILISTHVPLHANQNIRNTHTYRYTSPHIFQFHSSMCLNFFWKTVQFSGLNLFQKLCNFHEVCGCVCACVCMCVCVFVWAHLCVHDCVRTQFPLAFFLSLLLFHFVSSLFGRITLLQYATLSLCISLFVSPFLYLPAPKAQTNRQTDRQTNRKTTV